MLYSTEQQVIFINHYLYYLFILYIYFLYPLVTTQQAHCVLVLLITEVHLKGEYILSYSAF